MILDCKLISIPPGVLWEGQQKHPDQPEGRKRDVNKIFMFSTAQKNKHISITVKLQVNHTYRMLTCPVRKQNGGSMETGTALLDLFKKTFMSMFVSATIGRNNHHEVGLRARHPQARLWCAQAVTV